MTVQPDDKIVADYYGVEIHGIVTGVDGDTISVMLKSGNTVRVQRNRISAIARCRA